MNKLPQTATVADLRNNHLSVVARLENGPVVITSRGKIVAVVLSPEYWDKIVTDLDEQDDLIQVLQAELDIATGQQKMRRLSPEEIAEWSGERVLA